MEVAVMADRIEAGTFRLVCGSREQLERIVAENAGRILGVLAYGADEPLLSNDDFPHAWIEMPTLGVASWYEIWIASRPVSSKHDGPLSFASDGNLLFGCLTLSEEDSGRLEPAAYTSYTTIFDALDREDYPELLRVWNYFPKINDTGCGLERYREFNIGRHEAFTVKGRVIGDGCVPAACALGTQQGRLVICFLAGKLEVTAIENPRQTSAFRYPRNFGPKSPTFSRGVLVGEALLISGTASIVGSETVHHGDVFAQLEETLENLRMVIDEARKCGFTADDPGALFLNVYLRHVEDYPGVRERLDAEFGVAVHVVYLQADICRADLLVEVEAFWMPGT